MCESFIEVTVEIRVPYSRTIVVPTEHIEQGIEACLNEFPGVSLREGCQEYEEGKPEMLISRVRRH